MGFSLRNKFFMTDGFVMGSHEPFFLLLPVIESVFGRFIWPRTRYHDVDPPAAQGVMHTRALFVLLVHSDWATEGFRVYFGRGDSGVTF